MIKVLLTGSDGFIGKNIYKKYTSFIVSCIEKDWMGELIKEIESCDVILSLVEYYLMKQKKEINK